MTRWYCHECACAQSSEHSEPCWRCGAATTISRPSWWPFVQPGGSSSVVFAESARDEEAAA